MINWPDYRTCRGGGGGVYWAGGFIGGGGGGGGGSMRQGRLSEVGRLIQT